MRLKLMAPFVVHGFTLRASRILQHPDAYEKAWERVAGRVGPGLEGVPGVRPGVVARHTFLHTPAFAQRRTSRYRSIEDHSLERPLHAMELVVRVPALDRDAGGGGPQAEEEGPARHDAPSVALIRVFDHGIALLEVDLPVPAALVDIGGRDVAVGATLDEVQARGIAVVEDLVDRVRESVLDPLLAWLGDQDELVGAFLATPAWTAAGEERGRAALWVTRSVVIAASDALASDAPAVRDRRHAIARHWLKDVDESRDAVLSCRDGTPASSTSWLNYLFFAGEDADADGSFAYPERGWIERERATPFCPTWEALLIAQYYYAAFDRLQSKISRILAISVAGEGKRRATEVRADLDRAVRDARMLKVDFEENRKYYSRRVGTGVDRILAGWGFTDRLLRQIDERIGDCVDRLDDLHARAMERSSIYTDLILLAIGVTGVFEVLLFLSLYGRTMAGDPDLAVYDRTSVLNIANWLGGSSTDVILLAGLVFAVGLGLLYAYFRTSRSRI